MPTPPFDGTAPEDYVLRLYVAGAAPSSTSAVEVVRELCDEYLSGRYELEVIDIYQQPLLALQEQIMTVPTLVKFAPGPMRRLVGPLSDKSRVLSGLELHDDRPQSKRNRTRS